MIAGRENDGRRVWGLEERGERATGDEEGEVCWVVGDVGDCSTGANLGKRGVDAGGDGTEVVDVEIVSGRGGRARDFDRDEDEGEVGMGIGAVADADGCGDDEFGARNPLVFLLNDFSSTTFDSCKLSFDARQDVDAFGLGAGDDFVEGEGELLGERRGEGSGNS